MGRSTPSPPPAGPPPPTSGGGGRGPPPGAGGGGGRPPPPGPPPGGGGGGGGGGAGGGEGDASPARVGHRRGQRRGVDDGGRRERKTSRPRSLLRQRRGEIAERHPYDLIGRAPAADQQRLSDRVVAQHRLDPGRR